MIIKGYCIIVHVGQGNAFSKQKQWGGQEKKTALGGYYIQNAVLFFLINILRKQVYDTWSVVKHVQESMQENQNHQENPEAIIINIGKAPWQQQTQYLNVKTACLWTHVRGQYLLNTTKPIISSIADNERIAGINGFDSDVKKKQ